MHLILTLQKFPRDFDNLVRVPAARAKRNGSRGSPCRIPLVGLTKPWELPLIRAKKESA